MLDVDENNFYLRTPKLNFINDTIISKSSCKKASKEELVDYKSIFLNLISNVLTCFLFFGLDMVKYHFIGQLRDLVILDALGLGSLFYGLAYFIGAGLTEGMATECSRSYGNKNFSLLGIQVNQTRICVLIFSLIYTLVNLFFSKMILSFLIGEAEYISQAITYINYTLPAIIMELQYEVYVKLSESQQNYTPVIVSIVIPFIICPFLCMFFISYMDMGIIGCAIVSNVIQLVKLLIMIYTYSFVYTDFTFDIFSKHLYSSNFCGFAKNLTLSMLIFLSDCASTSVSNVISSTLGKIPYAKYIVILNISQFFYSIDYGFINTSCIMIGNLIGSNSPESIKILVNRLIFLSIVSSIPYILLINIFPDHFIYFFSESDNIYLSEDMYTLLKILSLGTFADIFQSNLQGVLRGLGIIIPTLVSLISSSFVFLPSLALILTKVFKLDVKGVIIADMSIYVLNGFLLFAILMTTNYDECCEEYRLLNDNHYMSLDMNPNTDAGSA